MASVMFASILLGCVGVGNGVIADPIHKPQGEFAGPIQHVVLLMFENRAFDHMAGKFPGVDGLKGTESNPLNTSDPNSKTVKVQFDSPFISPFDPNHATPATTSKIFGQQGVNDGCKVPKMDGFIEYAYQQRHFSVEKAQTVMNMFTPDRVPIMSTLASEFAIFDRFFCSHPGPTWPNRLFQLMGSAKGCTETSVWDPNTTIYTGKTIFDSVEEAGHDWGFYYKDAPMEMAMIEKLALNPQSIHDWSTFKQDSAEGKLPAFSWLNPRWMVNATSGEASSDQHPDHDVRLGEAMMKETYEILRSSPNWNSTMFIITYDEHGGFYDHVPPPMNVPAPDDLPSFPDKFNFTRLGVRIPVVLVSPWVSKGTVISAPTSDEKPQANSEFDATSIISTVKNMLKAPSFLTKRDAWAATFDKRLTETSPRTDCPMTLPDAPLSLGRAHALREASQPMNDLQTDIVNAFLTLRGRDAVTGSMPKTQGEAAIWMSDIVKQVLEGKHVLGHKLNPASSSESA
eukprot:m.26128 g.26128  ORF g.26128 m.26128 type:complete len:512 (+) comp15286_c0_seq2:50-1585(+)